MNTNVARSTCYAIVMLASQFSCAWGAANPPGGGPRPHGGPPVIRCQPESQYIHVGSSAAFMVQAENPTPPFVNRRLSYQWQRQGPWQTEFVNIYGHTNNIYTIPKVTTNGVDGPARFRVMVSSTNGSTTSAVVSLLVWTTNSPFTVFGSPYPTSGGGPGCPGPYVARVDYSKSASQGYGWYPDHSGSPPNQNHTPSDHNRNDTTVEISGDNDDYWCKDYRGANTHPGNPPPEDDWWVFTIYFPSTSAPDSYGIYLDGFLP